MDTRCEGISWLENIENIYLKFEGLCLEVAERMEQEISKGAESQSEMAGNNIKNLCSESEFIGEDSLPQSTVGTKEGAAPDSSLAQNTDDAQCINSLVYTHEDYAKRLLDDGVDLAISDNNEAACLATVSIELTPDGIELPSFEESNLTMPLPMYDTSGELEPIIHLPESESFHASISEKQPDNVDNSISEKQPDYDDTESGLRTSQSSDNPKLGESCCRVGPTGLQSSPCQEAKCRSYKKKLKAAFVSTLGLLKNHTHMELADRSGDLDAGFDQPTMKSFTTSTVSEKSPDDEFCESEWEIVE